MRRGSSHFMSIYNFFPFNCIFVFSDLENYCEGWKASGEKCVCRRGGAGESSGSRWHNWFTSTLRITQLQFYTRLTLKKIAIAMCSAKTRTTAYSGRIRYCSCAYAYSHYLLSCFRQPVTKCVNWIYPNYLKM